MNWNVGVKMHSKGSSMLMKRILLHLSDLTVVEKVLNEMKYVDEIYNYFKVTHILANFHSGFYL